jgi:hypothetical protein
MTMTMTNVQQQQYLISVISKNLGVELRENPELLTQGKFGWASRYEVEVADLNRVATLRHEFTHVIQKVTGEYLFTIPQFRTWMGNNPIDEEFIKWFLPVWKTWVEAGSYERRDLVWEFLPYYITYANNGWQVFQRVCRESGALTPPPGGYEKDTFYPPFLS